MPNRLIYGIVTQVYNEQGTCVEQSFVADQNPDSVYEEGIGEQWQDDSRQMIGRPNNVSIFSHLAMTQPHLRNDSETTRPSARKFVMCSELNYSEESDNSIPFHVPNHLRESALTHSKGESIVTTHYHLRYSVQSDCVKFIFHIRHEIVVLLRNTWEEISNLLKSKKRITAIRLIRARTGCHLASAKAIEENFKAIQRFVLSVGPYVPTRYDNYYEERDEPVKVGECHKCKEVISEIGPDEVRVVTGCKLTRFADGGRKCPLLTNNQDLVKEEEEAFHAEAKRRADEKHNSRD